MSSPVKESIDVIIVGQGIAGSVLALTCIEQGKNVLVIDQDKPVTSSKVAAGLYNPITGRKPTLTWNAALFFPYLRDFYLRWQHILQAKFLHEMPVFRPAPDIESLNDISALSAKEGISDFLELSDYPELMDVLHHKTRGGTTQLSGYVDTEAFLSVVRSYLFSKNALIGQALNFDHDIAIQGLQVNCMGYAARYLVFCEGHRMVYNPYFNYLPIRPNKGQIEDIRSNELSDSLILNRGVFVVPVGNHTFRVGATYSWEYSDEHPEDTAKQELEEKFQKLTSIPYQHHRSRSAIRPATKDRKPLIGLHPHYPMLGIFNGMGSKGVSMAPFLAHHFYQHLMEGAPLMSEVDIARYKSQEPL